MDEAYAAAFLPEFVSAADAEEQAAIEFGEDAVEDGDAEMSEKK